MFPKNLQMSIHAGSKVLMTNKTAREIFDSMTGIQEELAYELIGQALENGDYDREALVMFNKEQRNLIELLLKEAMK